MAGFAGEFRTSSWYSQQTSSCILQALKQSSLRCVLSDSPARNTDAKLKVPCNTVGAAEGASHFTSAIFPSSSVVVHWLVGASAYIHLVGGIVGDEDGICVGVAEGNAVGVGVVGDLLGVVDGVTVGAGVVGTGVGDGVNKAARQVHESSSDGTCESGQSAVTHTRSDVDDEDIR